MLAILLLIAIVAIGAMVILTYKYGFNKAVSILWAFIVAIGGAVYILWAEIIGSPPVPPGV